MPFRQKQTATPSNTPTPTPTGPTSTPTRTPTATATATNTATSTPIVSPTPIASPTGTIPPVPVFSNASFVYDGDGKRVKSVLTTNLGTSTTIFVGSHYEITDGVVTKYYFAGGQRIAMRSNGTLNYLIGDHLGSTSLVTDSSGNVLSQQKYKAWGEERYSSGTKQTSYGYTGQDSYESDFGLLFYQSRFYDPQLGRFSSADSIVPGGAQGLDRYAYGLNNPSRYTDPSGHVVCEVGEPCGPGATYVPETSYEQMTANLKKSTKEKYGIELSDAGGKAWDASNALLAYSSLYNINNNALNGKLKSIVGGGTWTLREHHSVDGSQYYAETSGTNVVFETLGTQAIRQMNIYHEFGHMLDNSPGLVNVFSRDPGINNPDFLNDDGYLDRAALIDKSQDMYQHPYSINTNDASERIIAQQEHWADIFANYVVGNIDTSNPLGAGAAMNTFVTGVLAGIP